MTGRTTRCGLVLGSLLLTSMAASIGDAEDCRWAEGTGQVAADTLSATEAKQIAMRQARAKAIAQVVGVEVLAETIVRDYMLTGEFIRTLVKGYITREQVVKWTQEKYQPTQQESPIPIFRVVLKACVVPAVPKRDPGFRLQASANKSVYAAGERARLEVRATRPAHVTIFNLTDDDRIHVYGGAMMGFPLVVDTHATVTFPPLGVSLTMELPPGQKRATEAFVVVATKAEDRVELPLSQNLAATMSVAEFYGALASIQREIIEEIVPYAIIGG